MSCFGQLHVMAIEGVDCFCDKNGDCSQGLRNISSINRVRHSVTELFSLSSAIQESVDGSRVIEVSEYDSTEEISKAVAGLRTRTESYIRSRFPDTEETLLFALVEANVLRLRRLFYQRSFRKCKFYRVRDLQSGSTGLQHHMSSSRVDFSTPQDGLARKIMDNRPSLPFVLTIGLNSTKQANAGDPLPYRAHTATRATWESSKLGENEPRPSFPAAPRAHECLYCGAAGEFKGTLNPEEWK